MRKSAHHTTINASIRFSSAVFQKERAFRSWGERRSEDAEATVVLVSIASFFPPFRASTKLRCTPPRHRPPPPPCGGQLFSLDILLMRRNSVDRQSDHPKHQLHELSAELRGREQGLAMILRGAVATIHVGRPPSSAARLPHPQLCVLDVKREAPAGARCPLFWTGSRFFAKRVRKKNQFLAVLGGQHQPPPTHPLSKHT